MEKRHVKILAIDDSMDNLSELRNLLYEAFPDALYLSANSSLQGLEICQKEYPDVILLDISMPGLNGFEVCSRLKSNESLRHIPIIMLISDNSDKKSRAYALEAGVQAFLRSPVDGSELKAQIKLILRIRESEDLKSEEKQRLEDMVLDRTAALEIELADRKKAENKLILSLDKITRNRQAIMNLMEDLKEEMAVRKKTEENLQSERNLLRTLIDNIPDTIYVFDSECRKIIANRADVEITGCKSEEDLIGKTDLEIYPGETGNRFYSDSMSVVKTGIPKIDKIEEFVNSNGEIRYLTTTQYPLFNANGKCEGLVGIGHDITNRKLAEQELEAKNRELSFLNTLAFELTQLSLTDNINEFLAKKIKEFSEAFIVVSLDYLPEKKAIQIRHIETNQEVINKVSNSLGLKYFESLIPVPEEKIDFILREYFAVADSLKELSFGQVSDITDKVIKKVTGIDRFYAIANVIGGEFFGTTMLGFKKGTVAPRKEVLIAFARLAATTIQSRRSEQKLKTSEEKYRLLIENQGEGVGIVDLEEKFVFANPAAEEMLGVEKGGLLNRNLLDFVKPEYIPVIKRETRKRTKDKKSTYEIDIIRPNGEQRTLLITATPQFSKNNLLTGTFGVFRDITDRKNAELEIVKKQEFIEKILENSPIGFAVNKIDDGSIVYVGSRFEEIYGVPRGSLKSVGEFFDIVYVDSVQREKMRERTIKDITSSDPLKMRWEDIEITTRNGELKYVTAINIPLYEQNLMISTVQDVTARNISEKALKESYEFNNSLLTTIPFGMDIVDENGTVLFQSANFHQLFGNKAIGNKCWELYRDDKRQCTDCPLFKGIKIGKTENYESKGVLGNKIFNISHTGILFRGKKAMLEIFIDITERKIMEQKIIESEAYYRTLVDISPDGIIITNLEGNVAYGSKKAYEIFGIPAGENVTNTSILRWLAPDSQNAIMERVLEIMKGNIAPETREYKLRRFDDSLFWGEISSSPLLDKEGNPLSLIIVCRDISDRKKAEYELIKSKEKAEESDRLKTAFLHNISHEIRTPMNAIIGFTSMLNEPDLDKDSQTSYIDIITKSSNHLLSIVTDIIEISNIEAGILKLNTKIVNLNSVIRNLYNQFLPGTEQKNLEFLVSPGLNDSEANVLTDGAKLTQVLSSLLSNAVKFTNSGRIVMGYKVNLNNLEFFVQDSGIGISGDQFSKIFERFYQVESTISRQYEGTGLGLSISKAYIELLGGSIWLSSEPGNGSTFFFTIPCKGAEGYVRDEPENNKRIIPHSIANKTVLVAEDEENNFRLIVELLSHLNLKIIHAVNGSEAVEICKSNNSIDLVIMDIKMPLMDGYEATSILKRRNPLLPVIAQTAFVLESDRDKILASGFDDYISKPVKKDVLIAMVKNYL
ncbi:MAG: PAS domain S-box protein [Bacteroidales bacterium]|nr:PAS domain S-box protein [Bacteroidales bacterium]